MVLSVTRAMGQRDTGKPSLPTVSLPSTERPGFTFSEGSLDSRPWGPMTLRTMTARPS